MFSLTFFCIFSQYPSFSPSFRAIRVFLPFPVSCRGKQNFTCVFARPPRQANSGGDSSGAFKNQTAGGISGTRFPVPYTGGGRARGRPDRAHGRHPHEKRGRARGAARYGADNGRRRRPVCARATSSFPRAAKKSHRMPSFRPRSRRRRAVRSSSASSGVTKRTPCRSRPAQTGQAYTASAFSHATAWPASAR